MGTHESANDRLEVILLSLPDAAGQLCIAVPTLRRWLRERRLAHVRCGRAVRIETKEIQQFIARNRRPSVDEITVAKMPPRISFNEVASHSWSEPAKYEQAKAAFEALGFQRSSRFVASPQAWVVEFWLGPRPNSGQKSSIPASAESIRKSL